MSVNNIAAENAIQHLWRHLSSPNNDMASSKNKNLEYLFTDCRMVSIGPVEYVDPITTSANIVKAGVVIGLSRTACQRWLKFPEMIVKISVNASRVFAAPSFIGKNRKTPTSDAWARYKARFIIWFRMLTCTFEPRRTICVCIYLNPS